MISFDSLALSGPPCGKQLSNISRLGRALPPTSIRAKEAPSPEVEAPAKKKRSRYQRFPDLTTLIDIAIIENRFDDVVDLYQRLPKTQRSGWETDKTVAQAVVLWHPDLSLDIWGTIVDSLIGEVKPKAYEAAAVYLRLMKKVYMRNHRQGEWLNMVESLRRKHKAKRRPIGVLDTLSKRKLVD